MKRDRSFSTQHVRITKKDGTHEVVLAWVSSDGYVCQSAKSLRGDHFPYWTGTRLDEIGDRKEASALTFEQAIESKYEPALLRLSDDNVEQIIRFVAHEETPDLLICQDRIEKEIWHELYDAGLVENLDREALEARYGFALPTDRNWWGGGWYYKKEAVEFLKEKGFAVEFKFEEPSKGVEGRAAAKAVDLAKGYFDKDH